MINKIFFIFFFNTIFCILEQKKLKVYEDWDQYTISIDGLTYRCPKCIPYKIKSRNGTISLSIPRIYDNNNIKNTTANVTFIALRTEFKEDHYWVAWPFERYVFANINFQDFPNRIFSVMGFEVDSSRNYYLLDQGIILQENNTVMENTTKLVVFSKIGDLLNIYYFNETDFTTSLLTDIVVDQSQKYAYITDSGNLLNNQSIPRIIVVDLKQKKTYKILNNNTLLQPDKNISITYSENKVYNYFTEITGLNTIQLSCDGEMLLFSSLKSKSIYRVYIKDINKAINNYEKTKKEKYLNNIDITKVDKGIVSQSFFISSKNNLFMTNGELGSIQSLYSLDEDLENFNFKDYSQIYGEKFILNWPGSIDIDKGKLYLLDNHYYNRNSSINNDSDIKLLKSDDIKNETENETVKYFAIYVAELSKDEYSYINGCSIYIFKLNIFSCSLSICFVLTLFVIISIMLIKKEKKKKNKKVGEACEENEENINELNRRLNEKETDEDEDDYYE